MSIDIHCLGCGKLIRAPREAAGRRARCPACGREMYVPTPPDELEELPLSPEDTTFLQQEAALEAERHRLDRTLRQDREPAASPPARQPAVRDAQAGNVQDAVIAYLRAMSRSDLPAAEQVLPLLLRRKPEVLALLDRLAADQLPPAALSGVPAGVYQGFLKHLRGQL